MSIPHSPSGSPPGGVRVATHFFCRWRKPGSRPPGIPFPDRTTPIIVLHKRLRLSSMTAETNQTVTVITTAGRCCWPPPAAATARLVAVCSRPSCGCCRRRYYCAAAAVGRDLLVKNPASTAARFPTALLPTAVGSHFEMRAFGRLLKCSFRLTTPMRSNSTCAGAPAAPSAAFPEVDGSPAACRFLSTAIGFGSFDTFPARTSRRGNQE